MAGAGTGAIFAREGMHAEGIPGTELRAHGRMVGAEGLGEFPPVAEARAGGGGAAGSEWSAEKYRDFVESIVEESARMAEQQRGEGGNLGSGNSQQHHQRTQHMQGQSRPRKQRAGGGGVINGRSATGGAHVAAAPSGANGETGNGDSSQAAALASVLQFFADSLAQHEGGTAEIPPSPSSSAQAKARSPRATSDPAGCAAPQDRGGASGGGNCAANGAGGAECASALSADATGGAADAARAAENSFGGSPPAPQPPPCAPPSVPPLLSLCGNHLNSVHIPARNTAPNSAPGTKKFVLVGAPNPPAAPPAAAAAAAATSPFSPGNPNPTTETRPHVPPSLLAPPSPLAPLPPLASPPPLAGKRVMPRHGGATKGGWKEDFIVSGSEHGLWLSSLTDFQTKKLEEWFGTDLNPSPEQRASVGKSLGLLPQQIASWLHHRRLQHTVQQQQAELESLRSAFSRLQASASGMSGDYELLQADYFALLDKKEELTSKLLQADYFALLDKKEELTCKVRYGGWCGMTRSVVRWSGMSGCYELLQADYFALLDKKEELTSKVRRCKAGGAVRWSADYELLQGDYHTLLDKEEEELTSKVRGDKGSREG
ncbi:unnamed protein product [Closterium sp. Naga37s-1]|nr:unnamed protein product [Closterium sp. Naga37s-1]